MKGLLAWGILSPSGSRALQAMKLNGRLKTVKIAILTQLNSCRRRFFLRVPKIQRQNFVNHPAASAVRQHCKFGGIAKSQALQK